jgi:hypothetical protein
VNAAYNFGTNSFIRTNQLLSSVANSFSYSAVVSPNANVNIPQENIQYNDLSQCVIHPTHGSCFGNWQDNAGAGLYVGQNGVVVTEHSSDYVRVSLSFSGSVASNSVVTIVYENKIPKLYLNGVLVKTGIADTRNVHPSAGFDNTTFANYSTSGFGAGFNGQHFNGKIDEILIWNYPLSLSDIQLLNSGIETAYSWSTGATTSTINVSPTSTTTYTCTVTTNGVTCTDSVTVVVNNPTIDLGNDVAACGTSTTLTAPAGFDSYLWSNGATTNTTTVTANGTYSCTVSQGGCSASDSIDLTLIDATISASDSTICAGETVTLSIPQGGSSNTACAALPNNLQVGLVGYWPFCGNANDASGNGNNGTVNGATLTTDRFGSANSAYSFDGIDDYISINGNNAMNSPVFTISVWVNGNNFNGFKQLITKNINSGPNESINLVVSNSQDWNITAQVGGYGYYGTLLQSQELFNQNEWHLVTYTYSGINQSQKLYLDNILVTENLALTNIDYDNSPLTIGSQIENGIMSYFFAGRLDDISFWSQSLNASEIQQLYTLGQTTYLWSNGATTPTINVSPITTTTYTCTVTTNGVSCTDSVTVVVNNPTIDLGNDVTACGTSTTLTAPTGFDSYLWSNGAITNTTTVTGNGTYTCTVKQGLCSATDTIDVVLVPLTTNTTPISACDSYLWNGTTYTTSGVYTGTTTNCVTESLNLTITPSSTNTTPISACDSYLWNGTIYTTSGVYTGTTTNCVTESLSLTITASSTNTTTASACNSYTWNGTSYTTSGVYSGTTTNCVTESLNLTITPSSTNTTTITACDSYVWNGTTYSATGVYTGTTTNCVTESLSLTITPLTTTGSVTTSICAGDSYVWPANGQAYTTTQSGLTVITGCNTATLNLTITPSSTNTTTITACNSYVWNGTTYTTSGVYSGTTTNCVTESLNLTITPSSTNTTIITACGTYTWANNGQTYTTSGVYTGTTTDCVTESLVLTITTGGTSNITTITACGTYTWANNGQTYTTSGVYTGTTTNCVTEFLNLTITPSSTNTLSITACGSYVWNGTTYASSGVYTGTTTNCITQSLNLTIIPPDTNTVNVNATPTYFWVFTGQIYTVSGTYQFLDVNKCVLEILNLSLTNDIAEESSNAFTIFPNPVSDMLYVNLNGQDKQNYLIIDNFGSVVKKGVLGNLINEISVSELSAGLYYFKIEGTKPRKFSKID